MKTTNKTGNVVAALSVKEDSDVMIRAERRQHRITGLLCGDHADGHRHEDHEHGGEDGPALARVAHHLPERVTERARNHEDCEQLEKIRKRRRVLERMRGVHVEETAAVRAELLDRDLARGGAERHGLLLHDLRREHRLAGRIHRGLAGRVRDGHVDRLRIEQRHAAIRRERLHDALRHEDDRKQQRQRQQDVQRAAHEVDVEVADGRRLAAHETADQRHEHGHAGRGREEVLHTEPEHLGQIAHRRFTTVALPVRVGGESSRLC